MGGRESDAKLVMPPLPHFDVLLLLCKKSVLVGTMQTAFPLMEKMKGTAGGE